MTIKILRVGDPHVKLNNLKDAEKLIDFIIQTILQSGVQRVELLGDLFHTHAVKRVEIEEFWETAFDRLETLNIPVLVLVGNHDQVGSKEKELSNALNIFDRVYSNVDIIKTPRIIFNIAYIPYTRNYDQLIEDSRNLYQQGATKLLVAHQTFTGAKYDNGFYAEDAIDPELICQDSIISGHIHTSQQIGKCFYPGTAKWDTLSDANSDKGIWIFEHEEDGSVIKKELISTENIVTPICKITVNEGDEDPVLNPNARNYLEFKGKTVWINKMKKKYHGKASIKAVPQDRKRTQLLHSQINTLSDYLQNHFEPSSNITKAQIDNYLRSLNAKPKQCA